MISFQRRCHPRAATSVGASAVTDMRLGCALTFWRLRPGPHG
ncbi:hypothetical protein B0O95_103198 [Mycetohabitans endofungorum]|uniref:Uncharacterized protein n=1 Tax=Mycetohabitans endofungorum TaxID=417203 RepID=A0A2P5KCS4_9BURK|nr:hypothetical protein B0O95_103198 [Mycetohabitans endofungorum]